MSSDLICPECNQVYTTLWSSQWCKPCKSKHFQNDFDTWTSGNNIIDKFIQDAQINATDIFRVIEWIPYDRLKNIEETAKGGFGTIYKAKWIYDIKNQRDQRDVALKMFDNNFASLNEDFLNEIAIQLKIVRASVQIYGITQDPETREYIIVLEYMKDGNLRDFLKNNFNNIDWKVKLNHLRELAYDLGYIHKSDIIHHDFHPGNVLAHDFKQSSLICISDFGLSKLIGQNTKNPEKRQIFGVLPYIAPEVLSGEEYTKAADVYSFGIIAYEIVTGFAPYYDIPHDRDLARQICNGLRPKIPFHIPKLITSLIMRCWDARVVHRPTFKELRKELWKYYEDYEENNYKDNYKNNEIAIQIENSEKLSKNLGLVNSTNPTPMNYKTHPEAIYTSRILNYSSLPKPKNDGNFENELDELTKSTSALSIVASELHAPVF
ncbi:hypothetical protein Glove_624g28 [Diversispora epigaea]|uniref:Protein kinase domain-containing protein n=1 Tax=Diversispora epigaea TaxID=1348612 RepID=A0A397G5U7_9GLOM|nr:hypothetical protein Glove_624g28 [Diversispora epigaea]